MIYLVYPAYFKLPFCWLRLLAASMQLELFRVYPRLQNETKTHRFLTFRKDVRKEVRIPYNSSAAPAAVMPTNPQNATERYREGVGKDDAKPEDQPVSPIDLPLSRDPIRVFLLISAPSVGSELSLFPCMSPHRRRCSVLL